MSLNIKTIFKGAVKAARLVGRSVVLILGWLYKRRLIIQVNRVVSVGGKPRMIGFSS
jgi:hypothetical protein